MLSDEIVLYFKLAPGSFVNSRVAAHALLNWIDGIEAGARALDEEVVVRLIGSREGSLELPNVLQFIRQAASDVKRGLDEEQYAKKVAIALATITATAVATAVVQSAMPPQIVELGPKSIATYEKATEALRANTKVQEANQRLFSTVDPERAIVGLGVADAVKKPPLVVIPRAQFAERSGLWTPQSERQAVEVRRDEWDVVVLKAPFSSKPATWRFVRDGVPFSAKMTDPTFLAAVKLGTLPIIVQEGVHMRVRVEFRECLDGQVWKYVEGSRKVVEVISPVPNHAP